MKNVFSLSGAPIIREQNPVNPHLISKLQEILARAENGEISSLVATGIMNDKSRISMISCDTSHPYELIGAITLLNQEIIEFTRECESVEHSDEDDEETTE